MLALRLSAAVRMQRRQVAFPPPLLGRSARSKQLPSCRPGCPVSSYTSRRYGCWLLGPWPKASAGYVSCLLSAQGPVPQQSRDADVVPYLCFQPVPMPTGLPAAMRPCQYLFADNTISFSPPRTQDTPILLSHTREVEPMVGVGSEVGAGISLVSLSTLGGYGTL